MGSDKSKFEFEKVMANVNTVLLTLLLLFSQFYPTEETRILAAFSYFGIVGLPFVISLIMSIGIIYSGSDSNLSERSLYYGRLIEFYSFVLGVALLLISIGLGMRYLGLSIESWWFIIVFLGIIVIGEYLSEKYETMKSKKESKTK